MRYLRVWPSRNFHGDKSFARLFSNVVDGTDIGMIKGRAARINPRRFRYRSTIKQRDLCAFAKEAMNTLNEYS
jgi:hypothetical protein